MTLNKLKLGTALGVGLTLLGGIPAAIWAQNRSSHFSSARLLPVASSGVDPDAAAVLQQAAQATRALHSLSADAEARPLNSTGPWSLYAHLKFKRPAQVLSESPGDQTSVVNGKDFWFYLQWKKEYQREADLDLNKDIIGVPVFSAFFFNPGRQGLILYGLTAPTGSQTHLLGTVQWQGETDTAIQITRPVAEVTDKNPMTGTFTAYFGADHLLHGWAYDVVYRGKKQGEECVLRNLRIDPEIPDSAFMFVPPPGSKPADPPVGGLPPRKY